MRGDPMSDSSFNSPATAHPWLHTGLMPALILSLVALVLLTLSRVLLIIWQHKSLPDGSLSGWHQRDIHALSPSVLRPVRKAHKPALRVNRRFSTFCFS